MTTMGAKELVNNSPLTASPLPHPIGPMGPREMSFLSSGCTSEAASGVREVSSGGFGDVGSAQRHLNPDHEKSKKSRRKKSPASSDACRAFKMTPEQHSQLLAKYWE